MKTYLNHPAYSDYPVTCISKEAAIAYCDWLGAVLISNKTLGKLFQRLICDLLKSGMDSCSQSR